MGSYGISCRDWNTKDTVHLYNPETVLQHERHKNSYAFCEEKFPFLKALLGLFVGRRMRFLSTNTKGHRGIVTL